MSGPFKLPGFAGREGGLACPVVEWHSTRGRGQAHLPDLETFKLEPQTYTCRKQSPSHLLAGVLDSLRVRRWIKPVELWIALEQGQVGIAAGPV